ncbi:hypothetical protein [Bradyrhizobium manausense]|uniref:Uncharacterized protein n=1 Tax=Bradyrhizobium manausense TaxID=989370 RepID=A0A0R3EB23_9BRAD|nr:hypothetical protein [Bradyrhizobium manausense]KRQ16850.1 hypothetical protein AOQ71_04275 [Bradyrhizobium manausense]
MTDSTIDLGQITTRAKTLWAVGTAAVSIITALVSTAIYVHDLIGRIDSLEKKVDRMAQQLSVVSPVTSRPVDHWNGTEDQKCEPGSVMVGARIGSGLNGTIFCTKVQPAVTP